MSTPGPLANQARSVYRLLIRASNSTFAGESAFALADSLPPLLYDRMLTWIATLTHTCVNIA
jgi:hypothetical protein